jgi:hypothetical protein
MNKMIVLNATLYPHIRFEEWPAPNRVTAQRWKDEVEARGTKATILDRWNGYEQRIVVQVAHVVTHG